MTRWIRNQFKDRDELWMFGGAALFYTILAIVMTFPLVMKMSDSLVGDIGDNIYFVWLIRWYEKAFFELHISPFFQPWMNYPEGWNLSTTDTSFATTFLGLPISILTRNPTLGYNVAMLACFVLSGLAMYAWVRELTGNARAGLIAGMIFAFLPYRIAHFLIGHLNQSGTQYIPIFFWGLYEVLHRRGWSWKGILLGAVGLGLISFTGMYYLYNSLLMGGVFAAAYLLLADRTRLREMDFWKKMGVMALCSAPLVLGGVAPFLSLNQQGGIASREVWYASQYSASPTDFILPSTDHFLWGWWVGANFDRSLWIESSLYIGSVAAILAGLAIWKRQQLTLSASLKPLVIASLVVIVTSFVLALGTDLHWNNQRVEVPVPEFIRGWIDRETAPIPMPALILFKYFPFYSKMRAIMRIGFFLLLFTSLLAGLGSAWLLRRVPFRWRNATLFIILGLVFIDFYPGPYTQFSRVEARPVDHWLASQPGTGAVAQFPFSQAEDQDQVYNTLVHGKPFIGGFFSANQPPQYRRIKPILDQFPSAEGIQVLRELGVEFIVIDISQYPDFPVIMKELERLGLSQMADVSGQMVFGWKK